MIFGKAINPFSQTGSFLFQPLLLAKARNHCFKSCYDKERKLSGLSSSHPPWFISGSVPVAIPTVCWFYFTILWKGLCHSYCVHLKASKISMPSLLCAGSTSPKTLKTSMPFLLCTSSTPSEHLKNLYAIPSCTLPKTLKTSLPYSYTVYWFYFVETLKPPKSLCHSFA